MNVTVHRDQAVWERQTFEIYVPDDVPEDEVDDYVFESLDSWDFQKNPVETEIIDSVDGMSTVVELVFDHEQD